MKARKIKGPDGTMYEASMLDKALVDREVAVRKAFAKLQKLEEVIGKTYAEVQDILGGYLSGVAGRYGEDWQGSANLKTMDESQVIEIKVNKRLAYDERLNFAGEKLNRWIESKLAKITDESARTSFMQVSEIAKRALKTDSNGNVDSQKMIELKKFNFSDPEWKEAIAIINESQHVVGTKTYFKARIRTDESQYRALKLNYHEFGGGVK